MTASEAAQHRLGLGLVALAALCWSTSGLFVRTIEADLMTMLFWRGLFSGAGVMSVFLLREGRRAWPILRQLGWPGLGVALASATSMIAGNGALRYTSVADALSIYATVPFVTAALAWVAIGERPARSTMIASLVALCGVGVILHDAQWDISLFGKFLAVFMTLGMAVMTVIMRRRRETPMLPAVGISAWICSAVCLPFATPSTITMQDFWLCAAFGLVQNACGLALYALGSRKVPAAEATLLAALEVPFTPLWVWLALGEMPTPTTLAGGAIVIAAMFGHILFETHRLHRLSPRVAAAADTR